MLSMSMWFRSKRLLGKMTLADGAQFMPLNGGCSTVGIQLRDLPLLKYILQIPRRLQTKSVGWGRSAPEHEPFPKPEARKLGRPPNCKTAHPKP